MSSGVISITTGSSNLDEEENFDKKFKINKASKAMENMIKETSKVRLKAFSTLDKSEKESTVNGKDGSSNNGNSTITGSANIDTMHFSKFN